MFSIRTIITTTLLLASHVWAMNEPGIPSDLSASFKSSCGLKVTYETVGRIMDGVDLTGKALRSAPSFALSEAAAGEKDTKYIVAMVDVDVNGNPDTTSPTTLHYLQTDFVCAGTGGGDLSSTAKPAASYVGPEDTINGDYGRHRYVFLVFTQPADYSAKDLSNDRLGFSIEDWLKANGVEPAIAGTHFMFESGIRSGGDTIYTVSDVPAATDAPAGEPTSCSKKPAPTAPSEEEPTPVTTLDQTTIQTVTIPLTTGTITSDLDEPVTLTAVDGTATTSAAAAATTHTVIVGGSAGLVYTPESIEAAVGDEVVFDFRSVNHTVTQSTLSSPCIIKPGGVDSGFIPNPDGKPGAKIFSYTVVDLEPTWWYCKQGKHCSLGMVFAINPKGKMDLFKKNIGGNATDGYPSGTGAYPEPVETGDPSSAAGMTARLGTVLLGVFAAVAMAA